MAEWKTQQHLLDHYWEHRAEFGNCSLEAYDASAQETLSLGVYFEYFHIGSDQTRIGCYDHLSRRLTILDEDDRIVSHFRCDETYVLRLPYNTYTP